MDIYSKNEKIRVQMNTYRVVEKIGTGSFSQVYKVQDGQGKYYVIKVVLVDAGEDILKKYGVPDPLDRQNFNREVYLAKRLSECPRLVKYYGWDSHPTIPIIRNMLFEYFEGYNLLDLFDACISIKFIPPISQLVILMRHIYAGLECMHRHDISHGDIHASNILFDCKNIKIIDYGDSCPKEGMSDCDYDIRDDVSGVGMMFENFIIRYAKINYGFNDAFNDDDVYKLFDVPKITVLKRLVIAGNTKDVSANDMVELIDMIRLD
jgi:serine/threonine protein kinase